MQYPSVSSAQQRRRSMTTNFRLQIFTLTSVITIVLVVIGSVYNKEKYATFESYSCTRGILSLEEERSDFCCASIEHASTWVCYAAGDEINQIMTSLWAFVIPLIPLACTAAADILRAGSQFSSKLVGQVLQSTFGRLLYSVLLILFRTVSTYPYYYILFMKMLLLCIFRACSMFYTSEWVS